MLQLFNTAPENDHKVKPTPSDPHTSFRDLQGQDVVLFANTIYESNLARLMSDPSDAEAVAWLMSDERSQLSFLHCCEIFNIDPDAVRASIPLPRRKTT
ncbi:hypothetical protein RQP54_18350 [Curvibacter sp. APW13]|uniref:hypothetical protein n=1 Tax=Curvibacter sp. APW13 TaxID=3077236 RepID=UPI0028DE67B5|nr:hypothetical protein [Curvibacter sp. APW13]MDT8992841.1 hypothetical protein [Curvibacter sp. APW13]